MACSLLCDDALSVATDARGEQRGCHVKDTIQARIGDEVSRGRRHEFSRRESHGDVT
jgi:hypothetical protein